MFLLLIQRCCMPTIPECAVQLPYRQEPQQQVACSLAYILAVVSQSLDLHGNHLCCVGTLSMPEPTSAAPAVNWYCMASSRKQLSYLPREGEGHLHMA